jgi:hypothetical protein
MSSIIVNDKERNWRKRIKASLAFSVAIFKIGNGNAGMGECGNVGMGECGNGGMRGWGNGGGMGECGNIG